MKDYLEDQGNPELKFPREVIKEAFQAELFGDGHSWLKALTDRNLTSHTYNETIADEVVSEVRSRYFPILREVSTKLYALL